jgi:hypothetical protein
MSVFENSGKNLPKNKTISHVGTINTNRKSMIPENSEKISQEMKTVSREMKIIS